MNAAEQLARDALVAVFLDRLKIVLWITAAALLVLAGYCAGSGDGHAAQVLEAQRAKIDTVEVIRHAAAETVTVKVKEVHKYRELVTIADSGTLSVRYTPSSVPVLVSVPLPVIRRIQADSALIAALSAQVVADSVVIRAQADLIGSLEQQRSRCGRKCGMALGALGTGLLVWLVKP